MNELTPWIDGKVKPEKPGVCECRWYWYDVKDEVLTYFNFWTGSRWKSGGANPVNAKDTRAYVGDNWTLVSWRGLAQDPKVGK